MRHTTSPGAMGLIVDAKTHAPVAGAEVMVSRAHFTGYGTIDQLVPPTLNEVLTSARAPLSISGTDGRFSIPPEQRWMIYVIPMDVFNPSGSLLIRRSGYEPLILFLPSWLTEHYGEIRLIPATKCQNDLRPVPTKVE
jgi:hypothetical protein